jgi:hypothetical protein
MSTATEKRTQVPEEEVARRIAEMKQLGYQRCLPTDVIFLDPFVVCPWPSCGLRMAGIKFRLEQVGDPELRERLYTAWWLKAGLVGACPRCNRPVRFSLDEHGQGRKDRADTLPPGAERLPDDWRERAYWGVGSGEGATLRPESV